MPLSFGHYTRWDFLKTLQKKYISFQRKIDGFLSFTVFLFFPERLHCCYIAFHCCYLYSYYNSSRTLCIKCWDSAFRTEFQHFILRFNLFHTVLFLKVCGVHNCVFLSNMVVMSTTVWKAANSGFRSKDKVQNQGVYNSHFCTARGQWTAQIRWPKAHTWEPTMGFTHSSKNETCLLVFHDKDPGNLGPL